MGFFVDKVSEDSFYENLLIGLPKLLDKLPNIHYKKLKRTPPASKSDVRNWENKHGVYLPRDLSDFYLSCDGLLYTYEFTYESIRKDENNLTKIYGKIEVNPLANLKLIDGYNVMTIPKIFSDGCTYKLDLSAESKVFELSDCLSYKVVLVYLDPKTTPTIWMYHSNKFYLIANDITTYLKIAIAHLGVPCWECIFSPMGLPGRSREVLNILAPSIFHVDQELDTAETDPEYVNKIDPNLFTALEQGTFVENIPTIKPLGTETSAATIVTEFSNGRPSAVTIGRKSSSLVSSYSNRLKRRTSCKRRPFTPRV